MSIHSKQFLLLTAALCLGVNQWPSTALAASQTVAIQGFAFSPATATINVGDTVTWMNQDSVPHTSTSDATPAVWDSGVLSQGMSFSFTFPTAGTFAYHCTVHPFMQGSVTVSGGGGGTMPAVPAVQITSPANGALFTAPTNVTVMATASSTSGSISNVEFLDGMTLIGTVTTAPYTVTIMNVAAGMHQLTAKATDNLGASTVSTPVSIQVNAATTTPPPVAPALTVARTATGLMITFGGTLQSADQVAGPWTDLMGTSPMAVTPAGAMKFYRARQ